MKGIVKIVSFFVLLLCLIISIPVIAEENVLKNNAQLESTFREYKVLGNKIYITPDQLHFTNDSIYIYVQDETVFIQQLSCDENGIYCLTEHLDTITDKCTNGHKIWCLECWGCPVRYCKFRCKCVTWE
jgi:hypothetical protein